MIKKFKRETVETLIEKGKHVHNSYYNYDIDIIKVEYVAKDKPITLNCPLHGDFKQTFKSHLKGSRCPECVRRSRIKITLDDFINKCNVIHNNKFDYSKTKLTQLSDEIIVICPMHGEYITNGYAHCLRKNGCYKCAKEASRVTLEEFIDRSNIIHNDRYDYSLITSDFRYNKKVKIICPIHNEFEQLAANHIKGGGCFMCKESKGEKKIHEYLSSKSIIFEREKFLSSKELKNYRFDFYLPSKNVAIEFNGKQHYTAMEFFGGEEGFQKTISRDKNKANFCEENNIELLVISYDQIDSIESILECFLNQLKYYRTEKKSK